MNIKKSASFKKKQPMQNMRKLNPATNTGPVDKAPTNGSVIDYLPAFFLVVAIFLIPTGDESGALNALAIVFVSIVLEAIPFMLFGSLVGGFIEAFVSRERMATFLPQKGWLTVCVLRPVQVLFSRFANVRSCRLCDV
jgi:hypothetical protein